MKKALLVVAALTTATYGTYKLVRSDAPVQKMDASLTQDRLWIDHIPKNDRDVFQIFVALSEEPFGVFQASSQWTGAYELFRYEMSGQEVRFVFPQNGDRQKATAKARECREHGHDYCLELDGTSRGVKKYYSRKGWEIDGMSREAAMAKVNAIAAQLRADAK